MNSVQSPVRYSRPHNVTEVCSSVIRQYMKQIKDVELIPRGELGRAQAKEA